MENRNITTNTLIKQMIQSDAIAYNMDYVSKPVDTDFGVLNRAYQETGREYAAIKWLYNKVIAQINIVLLKTLE